jgi:hypothetical protein
LIQIIEMSEVSVRTVATGAHGPATGSSWRNDPFVARLKNIVDLSPPELESLRKVVESELTIKSGAISSSTGTSIASCVS